MIESDLVPSRAGTREASGHHGNRGRKAVAELGGSAVPLGARAPTSAIWSMCPKEGMVLYSAGFFVTVSFESIGIASSHCNEHGKTHCMNLSAPFIMQVPPFKAVLMNTMPNLLFNKKD